MSTTQQILQAVNNLQSNAQGALPIIPNNGNPGGANNMPQGQQVASVTPPPNPYQWLEPSPAMQSTQQMLSERAKQIEKDMYNEALSQGKYRMQIMPGGMPGAQLLTDDGSDFDPYRMDRRLPIVPVDPYYGLEKNIQPVMPNRVPTGQLP